MKVLHVCIAAKSVEVRVIVEEVAVVVEAEEVVAAAVEATVSSSSSVGGSNAFVLILISLLGSYNSVRAMMFLGFFFMLGTLACTILSNLVIRNNSPVDNATVVVSGMAGTQFKLSYYTVTNIKYVYA